MRNREEIIQYLGIDFYMDNEKSKNNKELIINRALKIEKSFKVELEQGIYAYGLVCDFYCKNRLENENHCNLKEIRTYPEGVVLYKIITMKQYDVYFKIIQCPIITVEAKNKKEALGKAQEHLDEMSKDEIIERYIDALNYCGAVIPIEAEELI